MLGCRAAWPQTPAPLPPRRQYHHHCATMECAFIGQIVPPGKCSLSGAAASKSLHAGLGHALTVPQACSGSVKLQQSGRWLRRQRQGVTLPPALLPASRCSCLPALHCPCCFGWTSALAAGKSVQVRAEFDEDMVETIHFTQASCRRRQPVFPRRTGDCPKMLPLENAPLCLRPHHPDAFRLPRCRRRWAPRPSPARTPSSSPRATRRLRWARWTPPAAPSSPATSPSPWTRCARLAGASLDGRQAGCALLRPGLLPWSGHECWA